MTDDVSAASEAARQYITFSVGDSAYGVEITRVREIRQWSPTTELPNQPTYTCGVLNIRGEIVPVHDLSARFGGAMLEPTENNVVLVLALGTQNTGVLVDGVSDIVTVLPENIRSVPEGVQQEHVDAILGLVSHDDNLIALIEPDKLFKPVAGLMAA